MNPSPVIFILACMPALVISSYEKMDLSTEEGTIIYECFKTILCNLTTSSHFKAMYDEVGPECQRKSKTWFFDIYKMDANDPEFWNSYPDIECVKPEKVKKEQVKEFFIAASNYYQKACMEPTSEECIGMNKAGNKAREIVAHYSAIGVCENGSQAAEKGVEQVQNFGGELQKTPKPGFMGGR